MDSHKYVYINIHVHTPINLRIGKSDTPPNCVSEEGFVQRCVRSVVVCFLWRRNYVHFVLWRIFLCCTADSKRRKRGLVQGCERGVVGCVLKQICPEF